MVYESKLRATEHDMAARGKMRLGAFMRPVGIHTGWWRYPGAYPDAYFNLQHLIRFIQKLEAGQVRCVVHGRPPGRGFNMPMAALKRSATVTSACRPAGPCSRRWR